MALVQGPYDFDWNGNTLAGIESADVTYDVDSEDLKTLQGNVYTVNTTHKSGVEITLLESDIPALAAVLPQHHVANGGTLSTGETVNDVDGVIELVPGVESDPADLFIYSVGNPQQVTRFVNCTTEISGLEFTTAVRKVKVRFNVSPDQNKALVQFFKNGAISVVS